MLTANVLWRSTCVAERSEFLFLQDLVQMGYIDLVVVVLEGGSVATNSDGG